MVLTLLCYIIIEKEINFRSDLDQIFFNKPIAKLTVFEFKGVPCPFLCKKYLDTLLQLEMQLIITKALH